VTWRAHIYKFATPSEQKEVKKLKSEMKCFALEQMGFFSPASDLWKKNAKIKMC